jgi:hypothetical protein
VSDELRIQVTVDDAQTKSQMAALDAQMDEQGKKWNEQRSKVQHELTQISMGVSQVIQAISLANQLMGNIIGPMERSLMGMINSAVSMLVSVALAFSSTGIGAVVGAALAIVAFEIQVGTTVKMLAEMDAIRDRQASTEAEIERVRAITSTMSGFGGG